MNRNKEPWSFYSCLSAPNPSFSSRLSGAGEGTPQTTLPFAPCWAPSRRHWEPAGGRRRDEGSVWPVCFLLLAASQPHTCTLVTSVHLLRVTLSEPGRAPTQTRGHRSAGAPRSAVSSPSFRVLTDPVSLCSPTHPAFSRLLSLGAPGDHFLRFQSSGRF